MRVVVLARVWWALTQQLPVSPRPPHIAVTVAPRQTVSLVTCLGIDIHYLQMQLISRVENKLAIALAGTDTVKAAALRLLQQIPARMLKGELGERLACWKGAVTEAQFGAGFGVLHAVQA